MLFMIVPATARPSVPPRFLTKLCRVSVAVLGYKWERRTCFRNEVTTAMSRRSTPAWIAIRAL